VKETAMSIQAAIEDKLKTAFSPERLAVLNESHLHAGHHHVESGHHSEFDGKGETHFRVRIVSKAFAGMSRIERHRAINAALADELKAGLHALAIEPSAPGEKTRR
jgi:BolA protein